MTKIVEFNAAGLTFEIDEMLVADFQSLAEFALQNHEDDGRSSKLKRDLTVEDLYDALTDQVSFLEENKEQWIEELEDDQLSDADKEDAFSQTVEHFRSLFPIVLKIISDNFNQRWDGKIVSKLV